MQLDEPTAFRNRTRKPARYIVVVATDALACVEEMRCWTRFRFDVSRRIGDREIQGLSDVLIDCVEGGASVSFMLADVARQGGRVLAKRRPRAWPAASEWCSPPRTRTGTIVGTVQVVLDQPENQPHRGDLAKMLVHRRARRRGVGAALLAAAERSALDAGKTLLVLDTASSDAERLYARQGWQRCGEIPNYALCPDGTLCSTTIFFKALND